MAAFYLIFFRIDKGIIWTIFVKERNVKFVRINLLNCYIFASILTRVRCDIDGYNISTLLEILFIFVYMLGSKLKTLIQWKRCEFDLKKRPNKDSVFVSAIVHCFILWFLIKKTDSYTHLFIYSKWTLWAFLSHDTNFHIVAESEKLRTRCDRLFRWVNVFDLWA